MPTGYTAGILDGSIKDFTSFAKLCMRNFGATIHMRDEDMNVEYTPRTPSDFHTKNIEKAKQLLLDAETLSNDEIIGRKVDALRERQKYLKESILKTKANREKLENFLTDAFNYQPPTKEHEGIKKFMVQQLADTINFDGETDYYDQELEKVVEEMMVITSDKIRGRNERKRIQGFTLPYRRIEQRNQTLQR
jgi:hypothetical protein